MKVSKQHTTNVQYQPHLLYYAGNIINENVKCVF